MSCNICSTPFEMFSRRCSLCNIIAPNTPVHHQQNDESVDTTLTFPETPQSPITAPMTPFQVPDTESSIDVFKANSVVPQANNTDNMPPTPGVDHPDQEAVMCPPTPDNGHVDSDETLSINTELVLLEDIVDHDLIEQDNIQEADDDIVYIRTEENFHHRQDEFAIKNEDDDDVIYLRTEYGQRVLPVSHHPDPIVVTSEPNVEELAPRKLIAITEHFMHDESNTIILQCVFNNHDWDTIPLHIAAVKYPYEVNTYLTYHSFPRFP